MTREVDAAVVDPLTPQSEVTAHFDARARAYDAAAPWVGDTGVLDALVDLMNPSPGDRLLDLAAGTGAVAKHIRAACPGTDLTALDISEKMLARVQDPSIRILLADAHSVPLPDGAFDCIACRQGFHYFRKPLVVLDECNRLLAPGGRLLVAQITPFGATDAALWKTIIRIKQPLRRHRWTGDALIHVINQVGFRVEHRAQFRALESLRSWLSRYDHTPAQRNGVERLHREAPESYSMEHNFRFQDDDVLFDNCWTVILSRKQGRGEHG